MIRSRIDRIVIAGLILLTVAGCRLPVQKESLFSTRNELLVFDTDGTFISRSQGLRGVPRDLELFPDGRVAVGVDGMGITIFDPASGSLSAYFGPTYMQDIDIVNGSTIRGHQPFYMTTWYGETQARLLDEKGLQIGQIPIPKGTQDVDYLENGNLLLTEGMNNRIREMTQNGRVVWESQIDLRNPFATIRTARDTFLISDFDHHRVIEINRQNVILQSISGLNHPRHIRLLPDGNILVADSDKRRIVAIKWPNQIYPIVTGLNRTTSAVFDSRRQRMIVSIENFFPATEKEETSTPRYDHLVHSGIWTVSALVLIALFVLYRIFREPLLNHLGRFRRGVSNGLDRFSQSILAWSIGFAVLASWMFAVDLCRAGLIALAFGLLFAYLARMRKESWFPSAMKTAEYEDDFGDEDEEELKTNSVISRPVCLLIGFLLSWMAFYWTQAYPLDWRPILPWAIGPLVCLFAFTKRSRESFLPADIFWLTLIFIVAAFFRLYRIDELPYGLWIDETYSCWKGLIGFEKDTLPPFHTQPLVRANEFDVTNLYLIAISTILKQFNASFYMVKWFSLAPSFGIVLAMYCLGKWSFGPWAGRLAALLIAMNSWQVTFARWGWLQQLYVCLALFAVAFYIRSYKWKCPRSAAICGLFLGLGFFTYIPIAITTATLLVLFVLSFFEKDRLLRVKQMAIAFFLLFLVFGPLWVYYIDNPGIFTSRAQTVGLSNELYEAKSLEPLKQNIIKYATMFHRPGENNPRHNIPWNPILEPITGGLFLIGLWLAAFRFYRPSERTLLLMFFAAVAGGVVSKALEAPNSFRVGLAGPGLCLLAALPLASLCERRTRYPEGGWGRIWTVGFLILLLPTIAGLNYYRYFVKYPSKDTWIGSMGQTQHLIYNHLTPDDIGNDRLFVHPPYTTATFNLYTYFLEAEKVGIKNAKVFNSRYRQTDLEKQTPKLSAGSNVIVVPPEYEQLLKTKFPDVQITKLINPYDQVICLMGRVEKR